MRDADEGLPNIGGLLRNGEIESKANHVRQNDKLLSAKYVSQTPASIVYTRRHGGVDSIAAHLDCIIRYFLPITSIRISKFADRFRLEADRISLVLVQGHIIPACVIQRARPCEVLVKMVDVFQNV